MLAPDTVLNGRNRQRRIILSDRPLAMAIADPGVAEMQGMENQRAVRVALKRVLQARLEIEQPPGLHQTAFAVNHDLALTGRDQDEFVIGNRPGADLPGLGRTVPVHIVSQIRHQV